jgi:hypothetical protein
VANLQLKRIKKKLPGRYAKLIAEKINTPLIDAQKVARVFAGEITDINITTPVLDAALELIEESKKVNKRVTKVLNS